MIKIYIDCKVSLLSDPLYANDINAVLSNAFISETILTLMLHCLNSSMLNLTGFSRAPLKTSAFSNRLKRQTTLLMFCSLIHVQDSYNVIVSRITKVDLMVSVQPICFGHNFYCSRVCFFLNSCTFSLRDLESIQFIIFLVMEFSAEKI
jgi:hypothetical protein